MNTGALLLAGLVLFSAPLAAQTRPGAHNHKHGHAHGEPGAAVGQPGDPKAKARTVAITANDQLRYAPDRITVKVGETIKFVLTNAGQAQHEIVLGTMSELREHAKLMQQFPDMEHDEEPNALTVLPGKTGEFLWKFTKAGTFYFGCLIPGHFEGGMRGTIVVQR